MKAMLLLLSMAACGFGQSGPDLLKDVAVRPAMELEDFEKLALTANPTLQQGIAMAEQSAGQARQAGVYPNPIVGYQGEQIRGGSFGGGEQGAFVQQRFVLGGKLGLRRDVYEQQRRGDEIGVEEQRSRIKSGVQQSFMSALAAQETVSLRKRLLAIANDAVDTAHRLANVGQADAPDVLQAEVEAEQAEIEHSTAQRAYIADFYTLAAIAGKPEIPVSPLKGDLQHPPQLDPEQIVDRILRDSPLLKRAQQEVVRAQAELKSARREKVPDLEIHAGLQQNLEGINGNPRYPVGLQGFATVGIALPIFDRNQGNAVAAEAEVEMAQSELTRLRLSTRQSAQELLQSYLASRSEAERYRTEAIPRANRAYQLYLAKYEAMASAYPQVLISQRTSFQLQLSYISALQRVWMYAILLENYSLSAGLARPTQMAGRGY
jgi:cobalt-zinc-cadmium efflux system outer membrane protein